MKKKKINIKRIIELILILGILIVLVFVAKETLLKDNNNKKIENKTEKPEEKEEPKPDVDYTEYITETSESNPEKVKEFISEGMTLEEFKNALSRIAVYVEKTAEYEPVNYNFEKHLTYEELENVYKSLNNSEIVKLEIIGNSYDGKNIYSLEIGNGKDNIMLNGNIHAAEVAPVLFLTKYAVDLVNNWENNDTKTKELLTNHKIIIIPTINPDGYSYSINGKETINNKESYTYINSDKIDRYYYKANANGVDINRNLPTQTSGLYFTNMGLYSSTSRTKSTKMYSYYPGDSVGSEPETQALIYWMYKHYKNSHAFADIHSSGRVIYSQKQYLSDTFNEMGKKCSSTVNKYTGYTEIPVELFDDGRGTDGNTTDMIGEIATGYKFSPTTGRLSTSAYGVQTNTVDQKMCAITIETLEKYTQNLTTIKNEYENKKLGQAFTALVELNY